MSKTSKIFIYPILSVLMMLMSTTIVNGTHIVGGELTYRCLGNNEFEVTLIVRRDCENGAEDAPFDDPAIVGIFDIYGSLQLHLGTLGELELPFMGEDTVSNEIIFDCGALGGAICVHEAVYRDTISLPGNNLGYIVAYQRCCRNTILNNIVDPLETGTTNYSRIEVKALETCNSQPVFNEWPDVYICVNEELVFDHSAVDEDGDQLVYKLCTPMTGATIDHPRPTPPGNPPYSTIEWLSPYNLNNLMGGDALEIDSQTGIMTAKPNAIGTYLIGICVEEYRDGELLSTVRRDFEYNVRACTEPITVDFEVEGLDCDRTISCSNLTSGADEFTWYFNYPDLSPDFTSTELNPEFKYRDNGIYTIRLEAKRNSDGCTTYLEKTVTISDIPMIADFTTEFGSCEGGNMLELIDQSYDTTQISHAVEWEWIVEIDGKINTYFGNPVLVDIENAQSAIITLNLLSSAGCESSLEKETDISGIFPHADFSLKLIECVDPGFELDIEYYSETDTFEIDSINWFVTDNGIDMMFDGESFSITTSAEDLNIRMNVSYSNGCNKTVEKIIDPEMFLPELNISNDLNTDCIEGNTSIINFIGELTGGNMDASPISYEWLIDGLSYSSEESISLDIAMGDTVDITLVIVYDNNCIFEASDQFVFDQVNMLAGFEADLDCETEVDFTSTGMNVDQYLWYFDYPDTDPAYSSTEPNPSFDYKVPGIYTVRLEAIRLADSCMAAEEKIITVSDIPLIPAFDLAFESCMNGSFVRLVDQSFDSTGISHATGWTWEVSYNGNTEIFNGDNYVFDTQGADEIIVTLTVVSSAGCESTLTETIDLAEVFPGGEIVATLLECLDDGYLIDIAFINSDTSYIIESLQWTVNDAGNITTQSDTSFSLTTEALDLSVMLVVNYTNGCVFETEQQISTDDFLPILSIGFDPDIDCTGLDSILVDFYPVLTGATMQANPVEYTWTLDGVFLSGMDTISLLVSTLDTTFLGLTVEYDNNCIFEASDQFVFDQFNMLAGFDADLDCETEVDFTSTGMNIDQYLWYFDYPNTDPAYTSTEPNPSFDYQVPGTYTVRLEVIRLADNCMAAEEKVITVSDIPLVPAFDLAFESCMNGSFVRLVDQSYDSTGISHATGWTWEVSYNGNTEIFNGDNYVFDTQGADEVIVTLTVVSSAGCESTLTETIDLAEVFPGGEIITRLLECVDDGYLIDLAFINSDTSYIIESLQWTVNDAGNITTQTDTSFSLTTEALDLSVMLVVNYTNGCVFEAQQQISTDDFLPILSIGYDPDIDCTGLDSILVDFYPVLTGATMQANPVEYIWTLDGIFLSGMDTISLLVSTLDTTFLGLTVEYDNNCVFDAIEEFTCPECERNPEILVDIDCGDPEKLEVSITDTTLLEQGITVTFQQWTVDGIDFIGPGITFEMESTQVLVEYQVEYSDGCTGTYSRTFDPKDYLVELSFDVELLECLLGYGTFLFTNTSSIPEECLDIESLEWIIDGQSYTGDSVQVDLLLGSTVDVELIIHFTNGTSISTADDDDTTNDTLNTLDYIENVEFEIMDNTGVFCGDSINLNIIDPDPNLIYNWAFDSEFTNILFSGTELIIEPNEIFNGYVFAQAISDSLCIYGQSLIQLDDQEIELVFDMPFEICPGDTANFEIININPDQEITYTWKEGGDLLLSGADTDNPVIGIPDDHTEDFFMILCTENTGGCTRVDTIFFEVGETEDLEPFSFEIDSCGSLTINFMANNTFNGTPHWDFGDGNSSDEINPSNTYPATGTYLVVLSDSSDICAKNSYMDSIVVPEMLNINIGQDTIEFSAGETVIINAETNGSQDSVRWCLEDGTIIGMGNPLEYSPLDNLVKVCAKISDEYGCSDTSCVILKLRDDCPENLSIDGPSEVCVGDTFELNLIMDQDPEEFIFLWDPSDCIVSGGNSPNPIVTATTDKTFSVLVRKPFLCQDTIVSINVSVSDPLVSIATETGEANVCLGQEQTLLVIPDDPDCNYTWSTGETGSQIVVSPEVTTEYSVICINSLGCESTASISLEVILPECNESDVYLPNAFSPNGDNVNDVFMVRSKFIDQMEFYIIDRWGNKVFRTTDQRNGWDGTYKGEPCPPDAYAYYLMVVCIGGDQYQTRGNVSIIK